MERAVVQSGLEERNRRAALMTVLDGDGFARRVKQVIPEPHVDLGATRVQLHAIEAILDQSVHIALVIFRVCSLLLSAQTIVSVPTGFQTEAVGVIRHGFEVRKGSEIHEGVAVSVMVFSTTGTTVTTRLPKVHQVSYIM